MQGKKTPTEQEHRIIQALAAEDTDITMLARRFEVNRRTINRIRFKYNGPTKATTRVIKAGLSDA